MQSLLVWLRIPSLYQRFVVWWEFHPNLRDALKALRMFVQQRAIAARNASFGATMLVATKQIQSREELCDMSYKQIMAAYRGGRLDYLMQRDEGITGYGRDTFYEWVKNGGQYRP
jgi:hypothetical protein